MNDPMFSPSRNAVRLVGLLLPLVVVAANGCVDGSSPTDVTHVDEPVQHTTIEGTAGFSSWRSMLRCGVVVPTVPRADLAAVTRPHHALQRRAG